MFLREKTISAETKKIMGGKRGRKKNRKCDVIRKKEGKKIERNESKMG